MHNDPLVLSCPVCGLYRESGFVRCPFCAFDTRRENLQHEPYSKIDGRFYEPTCDWHREWLLENDIVSQNDSGIVTISWISGYTCSVPRARIIFEGVNQGLAITSLWNRIKKDESTPDYSHILRELESKGIKLLSWLLHDGYRAFPPNRYIVQSQRDLDREETAYFLGLRVGLDLTALEWMTLEIEEIDEEDLIQL